MTAHEVDVVRRLGLDEVLPYAGGEEARAGVRTFDAEEVLPTLTTEQRERVFHIARRRLAFQLLYEWDAAEPGVKPGADKQMMIAEALHALHARAMAALVSVDGLGPVAAEHIASLAASAFARRDEADKEFGALAPEWPPHRQPGVDRAILRLAHAELSGAGVDARIVINEAVELAKHFSTEKSPSFINALLDKVHKRLQTEKNATVPPA